MMKKIDTFVKTNKYYLLSIQLVIFGIGVLINYLTIDKPSEFLGFLQRYFYLILFVGLLIFTLSMFNRLAWNLFRRTMDEDEFTKIVLISIKMIEIFIYILALYILISTTITFINADINFPNYFYYIVGVMSLLTSFYTIKHKIWTR